MRGHSEECNHLQAKEKDQRRNQKEETKPPNTLVLDFYFPPGLQYFVMAAQAEEYTPICLKIIYICTYVFACRCIENLLKDT